jgi:hypothetical protein
VYFGPCDTFYTNCNDVWNCPDGSDELKCFDLFQCSEEMQFCVKENLTSLCSNHSSKCISPDQLCDCQIDCPLKHDDENLLCQYRICQENRYRCRNGKKAERCNRKPECDWKEDESLCDLSDIPNREKYFGLSNEYYQSYPLIEINERKNILLFDYL